MRALRPKLCRREAESKASKIVRLVRRLGKLSERSIYRCDAGQTEQVLSLKMPLFEPDIQFSR